MSLNTLTLTRWPQGSLILTQLPDNTLALTQWPQGSLILNQLPHFS